LLLAAATLSKTALDKSHNFIPGDVVEVCQGELIHLTGVIIGIDGDKIRMMPNHEELKVKLMCCHTSLYITLGMVN
jgi:transcription antitermination factor NusG